MTPIGELAHKADLTPREAARLYGDSPALWRRRADAGVITARVLDCSTGRRRKRLLDHADLRRWRAEQQTPNASAPDAMDPEAGSDPHGPASPPSWSQRLAQFRADAKHKEPTP